MERSGYRIGTIVQRDQAYASVIHRHIGESYPMHWHDYYEIEVVTEGTGQYYLNNESITVSPGFASLLNFMDYHAMTATTPMEVLLLQITPTLFPDELKDTLLRENNPFCTKLDEDNLKIIRDLVYAACHARQKAEPNHRLLAYSAVLYVLTVMSNQEAVALKKQAPSLTNRALGYINKHFSEDISLTDVAENCSVTPNHLGAQLSQTIGMSFSEYLTRLRLQNACYLLSKTKASVKSIAQESGFRSATYFSQVFKKGFGCTPREYREKEMSQQNETR